MNTQPNNTTLTPPAPIYRWYGRPKTSNNSLPINSSYGNYETTRGGNRIIHWLGYLVPTPLVVSLSDNILNGRMSENTVGTCYSDLGGADVSLALQAATAYRAECPYPKDSEANRLVAYKKCSTFYISKGVTLKVQADTIPLAVELCFTPRKVDILAREFGTTKIVVNRKAKMERARYKGKWSWLLGWRTPEPTTN